MLNSNQLPVFKVETGYESEKPVIRKFYHLYIDNFTHADQPQNKQSRTMTAIPTV